MKKLQMLVLGLLLAASFAAFAEDEPNVDPWMGVNKPIHQFNDGFDRILLRPLAVGYQKVTPGVAKTGVKNFFGNLGDVNDAANNILQGKINDGVSDVLRVLVNTTIGLGGLFDPASKMGFPDHQEGFGQTLAVWGVPSGPYIVLPGRGPSTVRGAIGTSADSFLNPLRYYYPVDHRNTLFGVDLLQTRESLLGAESVVFGDKYLFFRDAYLQRQEYLINDGEVEDSFGDDF